MKRELSSHEVDRLLDDARATWRTAGERDDALVRKASERRLGTKRRWSMREAIPIGLCAVACIVLALLLRSGSLPKESIRPEAFLAPPPVVPVAPAEPSDTDEDEDVPTAAASTPAAPKTAPRTPPASTLPQLPPPTKSEPQPKSIRGFFEPDGTATPPRRRKHRHPHFENGRESPPIPPHFKGKGRIHSM